MKKHLGIIKTICLALSLTLIAPTAFATTLDDLKSEQASIKAEQAKLQAELDELYGDKAKAEKYQEVLAQKVILTQDNIDASNERISDLNENIKVLTMEIELSAEKYEETLDLLKKRIISLYTAGNVSTLEVLLNATSLQDFSMRSAALETVSEHDRLLMMKISDYAAETKVFRTKLAEEVDLQKEYKKQLAKDIEDLDKLIKDNMEVINLITTSESTKQSDIQELADSVAAYEEKIQAIIDAEKEEANKPSSGSGDNSSSSDDNTSTVDPGLQDGYDPCFPLPSPYDDYYWVTSPFGYRDGTYSGFHSGYDIAAYYGTPIYATQSGTVISAEYRYDWGNNVYIYHNDTYSTRAAHMSSMAVSAGEYVSKGQVIGYVGSTGQSDGPHVHFELWQNGTRIDPEPYLRGWN